MSLLTDDMKDCIEQTQLCYVATVNADGTPNLSPKASLAVFDDACLVFANIASPDTVENLRRNPAVELNVVDIFKRRGYRFKGTAELMPEGSKEYAFVAEPLWAAQGDNYPVFDAVKIRVAQVREVRSPAYTFGDGITEDALSQAFQKIYADRAANKD